MEIQNVCLLRNIFKKSYGQAYVPVKSKPQHPPPGSPRAFEFLEKFCSNPPSPGRKAVQMPPPVRAFEGGARAYFPDSGW